MHNIFANKKPIETIDQNEEDNVSIEINQNEEESGETEEVTYKELISAFEDIDLGAREQENVADEFNMPLLKDYENKVYVIDNEKEYAEIYLINNAENVKNEDIFNAINQRANELKNKLNEKNVGVVEQTTKEIIVGQVSNEKINEEETKVIVKQEAGIVIAIISNNAKEIENKIDNKK